MNGLDNKSEVLRRKRDGVLDPPPLSVFPPHAKLSLILTVRIIMFAITILCQSCVFYWDDERIAVSWLKNIEFERYKSEVAPIKAKSLAPPASVEIGGNPNN